MNHTESSFVRSNISIYKSRIEELKLVLETRRNSVVSAKRHCQILGDAGVVAVLAELPNFNIFLQQISSASYGYVYHRYSLLVETNHKSCTFYEAKLRHSRPVTRSFFSIYRVSSFVHEE